jgi:formylglycine-generating enzyme required for sulfatase activity
MSGNVAEWTASYFYEGSYNFMADLSPDVRIEAADEAPPLMKRKVVRGGSWKDVGNALQVSARSYEYQDTAKSYIGFRTVIDLAPKSSRKGLKIQ